jgi:hypothetical protein
MSALLSDLAFPLLLKAIAALLGLATTFVGVKAAPAISAWITTHIHSATLQKLALAVEAAAQTVITGGLSTAATAATGQTTAAGVESAELTALKSYLGSALLAQLEALVGGSGGVDSFLSQHLAAVKVAQATKTVKLATGDVVSLPAASALPAGAELVAAK